MQFRVFILFLYCVFCQEFLQSGSSRTTFSKAPQSQLSTPVTLVKNDFVKQYPANLPTPKPAEVKQQSPFLYTFQVQSPGNSVFTDSLAPSNNYVQNVVQQYKPAPSTAPSQFLINLINSYQSPSSSSAFNFGINSVYPSTQQVQLVQIPPKPMSEAPWGQLISSPEINKGSTIFDIISTQKVSSQPVISAPPPADTVVASRPPPVFPQSSMPAPIFPNLAPKFPDASSTTVSQTTSQVNVVNDTPKPTQPPANSIAAEPLTLTINSFETNNTTTPKVQSEVVSKGQTTSQPVKRLISESPFKTAEQMNVSKKS